MIVARWFCVLVLGMSVALSAPAQAQTGYITGSVTAEGTGAAIEGVTIQLVNSAGNVVSSTVSDVAGQYRLNNIAPGTYTLRARVIGYAPAVIESVTVAANLPTIRAISMGTVALQLNRVVSSVSVVAEKALDAPASVSVVDAQQIEERPALTTADHLRGIPGLDISTGGIIQSNIVARGFNNAFSGSMLMLVDNRFASVPSLRVNVPALFTSTTDDIERMEVLLGPAAALYGPNSGAGVLSIFTKSPFTSTGSRVALEVGDRGIFKGSARTAGTLGDKLAYKVSAEKMVGRDFRYFDPAEPATILRPPSPGQPREATPNMRDFDVERTAGEFRMDFRPDEVTELIGSYGFSELAKGLEITTSNGAGQAQNWSYQHLQLRLRHKNFFAQVFRNMSDAGNSDSLDNRGTFLLRSGQPIVDDSRVTAAQLQQVWNVSEKQQLIAGFDYIDTDPRTHNTINGRNEDSDRIKEYGAYLHSLTHLSERFDLVAALRTDHHSIVDEQLISPRLAVVFKPSDVTSWRVTYNRAFFTPANFSFHLDLIQGSVNPALPYSIYALGNKGGFEYRRDCAQGVQSLCMMTPFSATPTTFVDAGGTALYRAGLAVIGPQLQAGLTQQYGAQTAAAIMAQLASLTPTNEQVGGRLALLTTTGFTAYSSEWQDIEGLKSELYDVLELGYKSILGDRGWISADVWYQKRENFTGSAGVITPNVFVTGSALAGYLTAQLTPSLGAAGAQQLAAQIAAGMGPLPLGTVVPDHPLTQNSDVRVTYVQVQDDINLFGSDIAFEYNLTPQWTLGGTYSWVSDKEYPEVFGPDIIPLALNAPDNKASLSIRYSNPEHRYGAELRGRYANAFPVNSGVLVGDVPTSGMVDVSASRGFDLFGFNALWSVSVTNVLDNRRPTFVGVPDMGRLALTRLQIDF